MSDQDASAKILQKVRELARGLGRDTTSLRSADIIPTSGILDSAGLMELILWYESEFGLSIPQEDFTIENLGSVDLMVGYLAQQR
jgi:D-alanine--poly(phosphoribitol) ligase subunit 2